MKVCCKCGESGEFYKRPNGKEYYHCKICQNKYTREHYRNNKQQYLDRNARRVRRIQDCLVEYLRKHPCVDCGEASLSTLDFDHVKGEKEFNVSEAVKNGMAWFTILREIDKCQVRCSNCHRKRTFGNVSKYQRTCGLMEKALVFETSNDGSSPSESSNFGVVV
jgi:hypothetical protein